MFDDETGPPLTPDEKRSADALLLACWVFILLVVTGLTIQEWRP